MNSTVNHEDVTTLVNDQVAIITTVSDYESGNTNLTEDDYDSLVEIQTELLQNVRVLSNVENITVDDKISILQSFETRKKSQLRYACSK